MHAQRNGKWLGQISWWWAEVWSLRNTAGPALKKSQLSRRVVLLTGTAVLYFASESLVICIWNASVMSCVQCSNGSSKLLACASVTLVVLAVSVLLIKKMFVLEVHLCQHICMSYQCRKKGKKKHRKKNTIYKTSPLHQYTYINPSWQYICISLILNSSLLWLMQLCPLCPVDTVLDCMVLLTSHIPFSYIAQLISNTSGFSKHCSFIA